MPGIVFKCWFFFLGWGLLVGWVPKLSPFLDHTEKNLNQNEWEGRLLQVSTPQKLPPSMLAVFSLFKTLREESPDPLRD